MVCGSYRGSRDAHPAGRGTISLPQPMVASPLSLTSRPPAEGLRTPFSHTLAPAKSPDRIPRVRLRLFAADFAASGVVARSRTPTRLGCYREGSLRIEENSSSNFPSGQ